MKKSISVETGIKRRSGGRGFDKAPRAKAPAVKPVELKPSRKSPAAPAALLAEHFPDSEVRSICLTYFNPHAREVFVAGTFNDWQPRATAMNRRPEGRWEVELMLSPGRYEYRLVVDHQWLDDPMSASFVANPFGALNSVLQVEPWESRSAVG